jgi:hypothetical protein
VLTGGLEIALASAALVAGLTGTWSPCGFSMIETLGRGHRGGTQTTLAACVTFTAGALCGGAVTFGSLALLGGLLHGADDRAAYVVAATVALAAAIAEARGTRIVPQVRRQLPEPWRRELPMPLAAAGYGVLLGLGFTTFVLTFGVFALAGISLALGDPAMGLSIGLAFGVGRALPVALTAPVAERPSGIRVTELMAERPELYRGLRFGDALALTAAAGALAVTVPAGAATVERQQAADPSVGNALAFQVPPDRDGILRRGGQELALPGKHPALGGNRVAVVDGDEIVLLRAADLVEVARYHVEQADALALSRRWLVWRRKSGSRDRLQARRIANPDNPGPANTVATAGGRSQLGRPTIDGPRLVYAKATARRNRLVLETLGGRGRRTLRTSVVAGLSNPAIRGDRLLYVRHRRNADRLVLGPLGGGGRTLLARGSRGTLWSTALGSGRAYVTVIRGTAPRQRILSVKR